MELQRLYGGSEESTVRATRILVEELETIVEETDGKKSTCVLIPLPEELAKQFPPAPNKYGEDPHISVLFVGPQTEAEFGKTVSVIQDVLSKWRPFHVDLAGYGEFENHEGQIIPHAIPYADEIPMLHNAMWSKLQEAGLEIAHHKGPFRPHATLAYVEKGGKYDGPRPKGRFTVNGVKINGHKSAYALFGVKVHPRGARVPKNSKASPVAVDPGPDVDPKWIAKPPELVKALSETEWKALEGDYYGQIGTKTGTKLKLREDKSDRVRPHPRAEWSCANCLSKFESDGVDRGYQFLGERLTGFCDGPADEAFCASCFEQRVAKLGEATQAPRLKLREQRETVVPGSVRYITRDEVMAYAREAEKMPRFKHEKKLREMAQGLTGYGLSRNNVFVVDFQEEAQAHAFMEKARQEGYSVDVGDTPCTAHVRHPELVGVKKEQSQGFASRGLDFPYLATEPDAASSTIMKDFEESKPTRLRLKGKDA